MIGLRVLISCPKAIDNATIVDDKNHPCDVGAICILIAMLCTRVLPPGIGLARARLLTTYASGIVCIRSLVQVAVIGQ